MTINRTGLQNPGCYAQALADCSEKLSKEHYLTESILKAIALADEIEVEGMAWQRNGKSKVVGTKALTGRILCERHNSALSEFDATALQLFQTIEGIHLNFGEDRNERYHLSGDLFERWMLKTLCGHAVAQTLVDPQGEKIAGWKPSLEWLEIIFQNEPFPEGCGMYISYADQGKPIQQTPKLLRLTSLTGPNKEVWGLRMWLFQVELLLIMDTRLGYARERFLDVSDYRPTALSYFDDVKTKAVVFDWQLTSVSKDFPIRMVKLRNTPQS